MRLINLYVTKTILASISLVLLMLSGLQFFVLFVNQLNDLGKADYGVLQALKFILLGLPYQIYLFFPMASLLGCLIGLGMMANHRELVVMRAAGMSITQITTIVLRVAILLILLVTLIGELLLPKWVFLANNYKMQMISTDDTLRTTKGMWLRQGHDFISIDAISLDGTELHHIQQLHFNKTYELSYIRQIQHAHFIENTWQATHIAETFFLNNTTRTHHQAKMLWPIRLKPKFLRISSNEPDEMTFSELAQFLRMQKKNHQLVRRYQLGYWQRLSQPLTTLVMMLLAIPFIFGPLRSSTMGSKLLLGAAIGFGFYILNRFFGSLSQIYQFSALTAAITPTLVFTLLGFYLMRRAR